jgi:uncharacterized protein
MDTKQRRRTPRPIDDRSRRSGIEPSAGGDLVPNEPQDRTLHLDRRTLARYVGTVVALGIPLMTIPAVLGIEAGPFILILVYALLLGAAIFTARRAGPGGVRRLFSGVLRWQIGWLNWAIVIGAVPVATIAVAMVTGTYTGPPDGWPTIVGDYLFLTFIFGALIVNVFEETAWQGLVQRNLTRRHGLLKASLLTAVPFAAIHLPLSFVGDVTTSEALVASAFLIVVAPVMRFVMGRTDHATGGSLLAVGVMHASFNASAQLGVVDGDWQYAGGLVVVAALLLLGDARRARSRAEGLYGDTITAGRPGGPRVSTLREPASPTA